MQHAAAHVYGEPAEFAVYACHMHGMQQCCSRSDSVTFLLCAWQHGMQWSPMDAMHAPSRKFLRHSHWQASTTPVAPHCLGRPVRSKGSGLGKFEDQRMCHTCRRHSRPQHASPCLREAQAHSVVGPGPGGCYSASQGVRGSQGSSRELSWRSAHTCKQ
jgi:hypothetical protein